MFRAMYSAAAAVDAQIRHQEVLAHNLAHLQVPGFRRQFLTFEQVASAAPRVSAGAPARNTLPDLPTGVIKVNQYTDFSTGAFNRTGQPLDAAIDGPGFFVVEGPGGPLYTRHGAFRADPQGRLVTTAGMVVRGKSGPIQIPADVVVSNVSIGLDGTIASGPRSLGQLDVVSFDEPAKLLPAGTTLFRAPAGVAPKPATARILGSALETPNTAPVQELVQLIVGMRHMEAAQRVLRTLSELVRNDAQRRG
jgi:flagellar basal body rod protein FlgG